MQNRISYYWYSIWKFFLLISLCVLNSLLLKHCVLVGKGIVLYTQLKMYRLGLDKHSVVFIEWEIGKMETANVYHKLITYIIWTSKIKNWLDPYILYRCHSKRMSPEEGEGGTPKEWLIVALSGWWYPLLVTSP